MRRLPCWFVVKTKPHPFVFVPIPNERTLFKSRPITKQQYMQSILRCRLNRFPLHIFSFRRIAETDFAPNLPVQGIGHKLRLCPPPDLAR